LICLPVPAPGDDCPQMSGATWLLRSPWMEINEKLLAAIAPIEGFYFADTGLITYHCNTVTSGHGFDSKDSQPLQRHCVATLRIASMDSTGLWSLHHYGNDDSGTGVDSTSLLELR